MPRVATTPLLNYLFNLMVNIKKDDFSFTQVLVWVLCLAAVSVGLKNFESGLSIDGPIFATIARNIARTGEWWRLDANVPDFNPFAAHPHLGFWIVAAVFRILPQQDWVARMVGHFFYVSFLTGFFFYVRHKSSQKVAVISVLLLWSWYQFSNTFSNVYLNPGTLFFGSAAIAFFDFSLARRSLKLALAAGLSLALCTMYKGMTVLGFLPVLAFLLLSAFFRAQRSERPRLAGLAAVAILSFLAPLGVYAAAISRSHCPDFIQIYWSCQFTHRFGPGWTITRLFKKEYWLHLQKYSYYLTPLALLPLRRITSESRIQIPAILLATFIPMFAGAGLYGGQYLLMVLPWLAWLIAEGIAAWIPVGEWALRRSTIVICIAAVFVANYLPVRVHGRGPTADKSAIRDLVVSGTAKRLFIVKASCWDPYTVASPYAWYGEIHVAYFPESSEPLIPQKGDAFFFPRSLTTEEKNRFLKSGWCPHASFDTGELWIACRPSYAQAGE